MVAARLLPATSGMMMMMIVVGGLFFAGVNNRNRRPSVEMMARRHCRRVERAAHFSGSLFRVALKSFVFIFWYVWAEEELGSH